MGESKVVSFKAPEEMVEEIDSYVEEGNYTSRGEFLRSLLRNVERRKLSEEAKKSIEKARKQESEPIDDLL